MSPIVAGGHLTSTIDQLVLALTTAMDLDEGEKLFHCWRVAVVADAMAVVLPHTDRTATFFAGLFHEVGGIGAPVHLLHYGMARDTAGTRCPEVFYHPYHGAEFVRSLPGQPLRHFVADIILQHHECWDGSGYPNKLVGEQIFPESLLIRAADSFDCYRNGVRQGKTACEAVEMIRQSGEVSAPVADLLEAVACTAEMEETLAGEEGLREAVRFRYGLHRDALFSYVREDTVIEGLFTLAGKAIDTKHSYTHGHSERVGRYAVSIAEQMGLPETDLTKLRLGAMVHDIGKLGVPRRILDKPGKLDPEEWQLMKGHAQLSWDSLRHFPSLQVYAFAALHHERWDGKGYPLGLAGEEIPRLARIMAVADALDAMTSTRSYRPVWTFHRAMQEIRDQAGRQFAPEIVPFAERAFIVGAG